MSRRLQTLLLALFFPATLAGAQQPIPPAATTSTTLLSADTPNHTESGATFTAPRGWTVTSGAQAFVIAAPEGDSRVSVVDVGPATDAAAAVAKAWAIVRPDFHRGVKLVTAAPARDGWDERDGVSYDVSPNEPVTVSAGARRKGTNWTVLLIDGSDATMAKRSAAVNLIAASLRAPGYHRESFAGRTAHPLDATRIDSLLAFLRTSMQGLGVPGAGVALVDHGRVVYEGGLGVRELGRPAPVDAHTLFMIASNTKGMSTLLLARLVDEGKLAWDQPVTQVYPAFRLGSDATTSSVLVRHLVCACTGLPRKDFDWIFGTKRSSPATTTFQQLALTEPTSAFGEVFQYNNLMASAAGYIGGHLVYPHREIGAAYDAAMQRMIFAPLGMRETTFDMARALAGNHASPHAWDIDGHPAVGRIDFNYTIMPYRPAGGAWSSAHDLIKYVQLELNQGRLPSGQQLVSAKNLLARRAPNVPLGEDGSYGMGLEEEHSTGVSVVHHGGSMAGYKSDWLALPGAGVGAVLLTNADEGQSLLTPFKRRLLELLYDGEPQAATNIQAVATNSRAAVAKERPKLKLPAAPESASELAAHYTNPALGHIDVRHEGANVTFDFGLWHSRVATRVNEDSTVAFVTVDPTVDGFAFIAGTRDGKRTLLLRDAQHEYLYTEAR